MIVTRSCNRLLLLTILPLYLVGARADVSRRPVKLADLPAAVRKIVLQQRQDATIVRLEKTQQEGKEIYEVALRSGAITRTVSIDEAGKVREVKQPTTLSQVSRAAKSVIDSSVGNGTIRTLESVKTATGVIAAYEIKFTRDSREFRLRIGADGRLVQE
jgi:hypothetical protein